MLRYLPSVPIFVSNIDTYGNTSVHPQYRLPRVSNKAGSALQPIYVPLKAQMKPKVYTIGSKLKRGGRAANKRIPSKFETVSLVIISYFKA